MSDLKERLRNVAETGCDPDLPYEAADYMEELEAKVIDQQARIELLANALSRFRDNVLFQIGSASPYRDIAQEYFAHIKGLLETPDDLSAIKAHDEELLADAIRYRWIKAEHSRIGPMASLCWKKNSDRSSSDWCNVVDIDKSIDDAIEKGGE